MPSSSSSSRHRGAAQSPQSLQDELERPAETGQTKGEALARLIGAASPFGVEASGPFNNASVGALPVSAFGPLNTKQQELVRKMKEGHESGRSWADVQHDIAQHLMSQQPEGEQRHVQFQPMNPVCDAAEQGDLPALTRIVATGTNVDTRGENGNSALAFACANGHADCTAFLISKGADINLPSNLGNTPLHAAAWADSTKCIRILADAKANVNQPSTSGLTPMHVAVQGARDEALVALMDHGADRTIKNNGKTPLQLAVSLRHEMCERVLRQADQQARLLLQAKQDVERAEAEVRANAAADALLAELELEEEAASGGGKKKKKGKKGKKKKK